MNSPALEAIKSLGLGFTLLMAFAWLLSLRLKFLSLVDAFWAYGIALGSAWILLKDGQNSTRSLVAAGLVLIWGLRLGTHLTVRLKRHFPAEDTRYEALRSSWSEGLLWKSGLFFFFQALTQILFSSPFILIAQNSSPFPNGVEAFGIIISILGIIGESISDSQLKRFKSSPIHRGEVCDVGLWRYSRHPNYFFEWLIWCGFGLIALQAPFGVYAVIAPITMLLLLLFVTGVRPAEIQSLRSRGDAYRAYQMSTSPFVPWFSNRKKNENAH